MYLRGFELREPTIARAKTDISSLMPRESAATGNPLDYIIDVTVPRPAPAAPAAPRINWLLIGAAIAAIWIIRRI